MKVYFDNEPRTPGRSRAKADEKKTIIILSAACGILLITSIVLFARVISLSRENSNLKKAGNSESIASDSNAKKPSKKAAETTKAEESSDTAEASQSSEESQTSSEQSSPVSNASSVSNSNSLASASQRTKSGTGISRSAGALGANSASSALRGAGSSAVSNTRSGTRQGAASAAAQTSTARKASAAGQGSSGNSSRNTSAVNPTSAVPTQTAATTEAAATTAATNNNNSSSNVDPGKQLENLTGIASGTVLTDTNIDSGNIGKYFVSMDIDDGGYVYNRIVGKSFKRNTEISLSSLKYIKVLHYNFNNNIQVGEMIVNKDIADDVLNIFKELFEAKYQINSMHLVDNYWTGNPMSSDWQSIEANNTSGFCYRKKVNESGLSLHAYGRAIDINPQQNPYVSYSSGSAKWSHSNADAYVNRESGQSHMISHDDKAYQVFTKYGFRWGGDFSEPKDYQHFEKE